MITAFLFLSDLGTKGTEGAFESAFGMNYEEYDRHLRLYVRHGRYGIGEIELKDRHTEMEVAPASDVAVEFALGRLAVGVGSYGKGMQHAEAVIASVPSRPEGYELLAMASRSPALKTRQVEALEKAISLDEKYGKMATEDSDFDDVRESACFRALVQGDEP